MTHLVDAHRLSERRACELAGISRTGYRYQVAPKKDDTLHERLKALAVEHRGLGYPMLHGMLKSEGLVINIKHTYRLYSDEKLQLQQRKKKKLNRPRMPMVVPVAPDIRGSIDFVSDQLANGRRFRVLNVKDDHLKELVGQLVAFSISGQMVEERSKPDQIVCDNGTEFTSKTMFYWQEDVSVKLAFFQPGKPKQNAFVESLNGRFRQECLNQHWFRTLEEARAIIDKWRHHYNHERPHSSLNYMTPVAFANLAA